MERKCPRLLIAGTNSGCGKTTVSIALMKAFSAGTDLCAFKCGPDYIDPMFHRAVLWIPSYNLDPFFCGRDRLCEVLSDHARRLSLIEGVMGYYDGIGTDGGASTYSVAEATETPAVLVVNVRGMYTSAGAVISGFKNFRKNSRIEGVIFNGTSAMLYKDLKIIAEDAGVRAYGFMPKVPEAELGSRHLGLITASEVQDLQDKISSLAGRASESIDLDGLLALADSAPELEFERTQVFSEAFDNSDRKKLRLAVARDEAFCFIYEENLELLEKAGFETVWFSPLHDETLPEDISALYLPGGYPELYPLQLSENNKMLNSVNIAITEGLPTFAECGGFMYLHEKMDGYPMAGIVKGNCFKTDRLQRFGYITITAKEDNMFCRAGESIRAHEFHYYDSDDSGCGFKAEKPTGRRSWECVHTGPSLYAGYPHLYLPANPSFAENFYRKASEYVIR